MEIEANAVKQVAEKSCWIGIELERVVLTPTGVLLGCWQVCASFFSFSDSNYCKFAVGLQLHEGHPPCPFDYCTSIGFNCESE